jgi:hypothetical protein
MLSRQVCPRCVRHARCAAAASRAGEHSSSRAVAPARAVKRQACRNAEGVASALEKLPHVRVGQRLAPVAVGVRLGLAASGFVAARRGGGGAGSGQVPGSERKHPPQLPNLFCGLRFVRRPAVQGFIIGAPRARAPTCSARIDIFPEPALSMTLNTFSSLDCRCRGIPVSGFCARERRSAARSVRAGIGRAPARRGASSGSRTRPPAVAALRPAAAGGAPAWPRRRPASGCRS